MITLCCFADKDSDRDERLSKANIDLDKLHHEIRHMTSDLYKKEEKIAQLKIQMEGDEVRSFIKAFHRNVFMFLSDIFVHEILPAR